MATTEQVLGEIGEERRRQQAAPAIGELDRSNSRSDWVAYINAYAGRAASNVPRNVRDVGSCAFRSMMVKVAALAVAAIEANDQGWLD